MKQKLPFYGSFVLFAGWTRCDTIRVNQKRNWVCHSGKIFVMRIAEIQRKENPYHYFGNFRGMPFWGGSLTLLGAAPGIGKTSWLLGMLMEASAQKISSVLACYEHTPEELLFRLQAQAVASIAGPHDELNDSQKAEEVLAKSATGLVLSLNDREDTIPGIEKNLLKTYGFPTYGYAFVAVDYLQRIPVVGTTGLVSEAYRGGEAAAELRKMARRHNWAVIATALDGDCHI